MPHKYFQWDPGRPLPWIILALLVKGIMFFLFLGNATSEIPGFLGADHGDTPNYLDPVDNLIQLGNYSPDFRMPGYGALYFLFRLVFEKPVSCNLLIFSQVILAAVSVYYLASTAYTVFKNKFIFYGVYVAFLISTFTGLFDPVLATESFTASASIFGIYFLARHKDSGKSIHLFYSGLFFTWTIFLKPIYLPYLALVAGIIFLEQFRERKNFRKSISQVLIFLCPFIIIDGAWVVRNFKIYSRIIPLTSSLYHPKLSGTYYLELMEFLQSWGGSFISWDPIAEIRFFGVTTSTRRGHPPLEERKIILPDYIYTSKFNLDTLNSLKPMIARLYNDSTPDEEKKILNADLKDRFFSYTRSIRREHPFLYFAGAPFILFKKFLIHSGTYNLFNKSYTNLNFAEKTIKIAYSLFYLFIILYGSAGMIVLIVDTIKNKVPTPGIFFTLSSLYTFLIFPFIMRFTENRYLVPVYPFLLVCAVYFVHVLITRIKKRSGLSTA